MMGHDESRMVKWIANAIISEWVGQKTTSLAESLFEDSKYELLDYQPAEPDVGIQCGGWCDFEFTGSEEKAIMKELEANPDAFHQVFTEMLATLNERRSDDHR